MCVCASILWAIGYSIGFRQEPLNRAPARFLNFPPWIETFSCCKATWLAHEGFEEEDVEGLRVTLS